MHNGAPVTTPLDQKLQAKPVAHYQEKLDLRKRVRRQKQETYEKRRKRRDAYQTEVEERREKKDNTVYFDGTNYSIRWSFMPR